MKGQTLYMPAGFGAKFKSNIYSYLTCYINFVYNMVNNLGSISEPVPGELRLRNRPVIVGNDELNLKIHAYIT